MNVLDRIFGRLGVKVHNTDRLGFLGDSLPDENELNRVVSLYRQGVHDDLTAAMEKAKPGKKLNIITTSSGRPKADSLSVPVADKLKPTPEPAAVDPDPGPAKESLRAKWRRLKAELKEVEDDKGKT